jgi:hypothetical protein
MTAELVPYREGDDVFDALVARPEGVGPRTAVLVCHAYGGCTFTNPKANDPAFGTVYDADADRRSWLETTRFSDDVLG